MLYNMLCYIVCTLLVLKRYFQTEIKVYSKNKYTKKPILSHILLPN
jgi:alpha-N-acetylglucosamine transferase